MRRWTVPILAMLAIALFLWLRQPAAPLTGGPAAASIPSTDAAPAAPAPPSDRNAASQNTSSGALPSEVADTLALIRRGGPFPYHQDGVVFQNREHRLPGEAYGYYHEYTVATPGVADRGARRIIVGGEPPAVYYYTGDHYRSFSTLEVPR